MEIVDAVGVAYCFLPFLSGPVFTLLWAPASALLVHRLLGRPCASAVAFVEEALPVAHVIPTATAAWWVQRQLRMQERLEGREANGQGEDWKREDRSEDYDENKDGNFVAVDHFIVDVHMRCFLTCLVTAHLLNPWPSLTFLLEIVALIFILLDEVRALHCPGPSSCLHFG